MRDKVLCTFSGGYGDILWSLATVRELSKRYGTPVDMMVMPKYESLLPLLKEQSYIKEATINTSWICTGQPHGDQPWEAPVPTEIYDQIYHLTYRRHPLPTESLIDFIAAPHLVHLSWQLNPIPFIEVPEHKMVIPYIAYAFNDMYPELKNTIKLFVKQMAFDLDCGFLGTSELPWTESAAVIRDAMCFIGCRSSNYVIAHGVGQKNILVYEPHPSRSALGMYGKTFGNPYWPEITLNLNPVVARVQLYSAVSRYIQEKNHEISETSSR